jgi:hypothetical protein
VFYMCKDFPIIAINKRHMQGDIHSCSTISDITGISTLCEGVLSPSRDIVNTGIFPKVLTMLSQIHSRCSGINEGVVSVTIVLVLKKKKVTLE